jgi:hypothetical protein
MLVAWGMALWRREVVGGAGGVTVEARDISLAGRIIANFADFLAPEQRIPDDLAYLGKLCQEPTTNIITVESVSTLSAQSTEKTRRLVRPRPGGRSVHCKTRRCVPPPL